MTKVLSTQAPQLRQFALISDFLDLANSSLREEPALATNWIKDRHEGLKLQNLALATVTGAAIRSYPDNTTADVQHAVNQCGGELVVLGTRLLSGSAHGCCLLTSRKVKSRRKCWKLR